MACERTGCRTILGKDSWPDIDSSVNCGCQPETLVPARPAATVVVVVVSVEGMGYGSKGPIWMTNVRSWRVTEQTEVSIGEERQRT